MAGNARFDLTSASPDSSFGGNYQNGQRGYSAPTLDRSTSFRDGTESRNFASGKTNSRANATSPGDVTTLSQFLTLEPISMEQKHARSSDIRRVLGFSVGTSSEDNSFGTAHGKNIPPGALEDLKRVRASVADSCVKASCRAKKLDDQLIKLNKCIDVMPSKKQQQRIEMLANERSSGSVLKIGSVMHRNPAEFGSQKFDDRPKNGLNKRLRTSVAETRVSRIRWIGHDEAGFPSDSGYGIQLGNRDLLFIIHVKCVFQLCILSAAFLTVFGCFVHRG